MKRSELEALGLNPEQVTQVMKINGDDIENAKSVVTAESQKTIDGLNAQITTLTGQVSKRDDDIKSIKQKLKDAQTDAGKLEEVQSSLTALQDKYTADTQALRDQVSKQAYDFALDKGLSGVNFSSKAARAQFIKDVGEKGLKVEGQEVLGLADYIKSYKDADPGAFAPEEPEEPKAPVPPIVSGKGSQGGSPGSDNPFQFQFIAAHPSRR